MLRAYESLCKYVLQEYRGISLMDIFISKGLKAATLVYHILINDLAMTWK